MALTPAESFARFTTTEPAVTAVCVAYSGGRDSHVLLHLAAAHARETPGFKVRALHIDHALHEHSTDWALHCQSVCDDLNVPLQIRRVSVDPTGEGVEAGARRARYSAFIDTLAAGEHMLLAQHIDDQAETFLLQALRGSGPDGLASMPRRRQLGKGCLSRPLLACRAASLAEVALAAGLVWIDDPSNEDRGLDRNYLRHEIMPLLTARWPAAVQTLGRAAERCGGASKTLMSLAREDLAGVRHGRSSQLSTVALAALPRERAFNAIRLWVRESSRRMPRLQDLEQVWRTLVLADESSSGTVNVREYEFRRHANRLYLLTGVEPAIPFEHQWPAPYKDLLVPEAGVTLTREAAEQQGLALPESGGVRVCSRQGGESLKLGFPAYHKTLKDLLREAGIPPWDRPRIPLLFEGDDMVAVWQLAVAVDHRISDSSPVSSGRTEEA